MQTDFLQEARRQAEICNACRYCEGYCSVFPALHSERLFSDGDLTQLANLCHNCRGCYYACQYTSPHEFDLNLPKALAEVRQESWEHFAWPEAFAKRFQSSGLMIAIASVLCFSVFFLTIRTLGSAGGEGFYAVLSHTAMVSIFLPAFVFPLFSLAISMRRYWSATNGEPVRLSHIVEAFGSAARMKTWQAVMVMDAILKTKTGSASPDVLLTRQSCTAFCFVSPQLLPRPFCTTRLICPHRIQFGRYQNYLDCPVAY